MVEVNFKESAENNNKFVSLWNKVKAMPRSKQSLLVGGLVAVVGFSIGSQVETRQSTHASNDNLTFTVASEGTPCDSASSTNVKDTSGNPMSCINNIYVSKNDNGSMPTTSDTSDVTISQIQKDINSVQDNSSELVTIQNNADQIDSTDVNTDINADIPDESLPVDNTDTNL